MIYFDPMENHSLISAQNVTKYYGKVTGVKDISFDVGKGEIFGFLGPNGSGKTTTIRLLLDLLRPSDGKIEIFGLNLLDNSHAIRKRCGYLPGNFSAYGNLTGNEFLKFLAGLRNNSVSGDKKLPERLGISSFDMKRKIRQLSHGTLQKLGIIQAFIHSPELLILDEPTIGLDPLMQYEFYDLLKEYQKEGGTVFLSSHNLSEIERICHRVAIIRKGEIVKDESIVNLRKRMKRKLILNLKSPVENINIPGARLLRKDGLTLEFEVDGDISVLIKHLSSLPVADIVLPEPDLHEIFMNYYNGKHEE
jgi:ABC-2 type transport system ATP-binding protein